MIEQSTIDQVRERVEIEQVVSDYVVLRRQGKSLVGHCPFHDDKTPSFSVNPGQNLYYCHGCGAGGDGIKFLSQISGLSFVEAVVNLADRYSLQVRMTEGEDEPSIERLTIKPQLLNICTIARSFYQSSLHSDAAALSYLRSRGFSDETIEVFQLGYAPNAWDGLLNHLTAKSFSPELIEQSGLIIKRETADGYYDRFRDRLMIPIRDIQGNCIGFGGRSLGSEMPKYLNSPETLLFNKSKTLYGLDLAYRSIAKEDAAIVVEGYFDAIALYAQGIHHVVASLGTAINAAQIKMLLRHTNSKTIYLNFDGDSAGVKATHRGIQEVEQMAAQGDLNLKILALPNGDDPDDFLRHHTGDDYKDLIAQAPTWVEWQINQVVEATDFNKIDQFQAASQAIAKIIGKITDAVVRTKIIHTTSSLMASGDSRLTDLIGKDLRQQVKGERWVGLSEKWMNAGTASLLEEAEAQLLRIYLHQSDLRGIIQEALALKDMNFSLAKYRYIWNLILTTPDHTDNLSDRLQRRLVEDEQELSNWDTLFRPSFLHQIDINNRPLLIIQGAIGSMEKVVCEKRLKHLKELWLSIDRTQSPDRLREIQSSFYAEKRRIEQINAQSRQVSSQRTRGLNT